jgi:uncharacterized phiE125 gp8 family phage protein
MIRYALKTAQTTWVLYPSASLTEIKLHLRVDHTDDDALITLLLKAAEERLKEELDLYVSAATYIMYMDGFPTDTDNKQIEIWAYPVSAISSVKYIDENGAEQTVSSTNYKKDLVGKPARVVPYDSFAWPATKTNYPNSVYVEFVTGWTSPATCPEDIRWALKLIVADGYENREDKGRQYARTAEILLRKYLYV